MKNQISIIVIFISTLLFSQSPILPLNGGNGDIPHNAYLKDTENQLMPFIGTWVYQEGTTKVTIKFQKIMYHFDLSTPHYYKDRLKANYKVEKNGVVIHDDLSQPIGTNSKIYGFNFFNGRYSMSYVDYPKCGIMGSVEIWIDANGELHWEMYMSDPNPYKIEECPAFQNPDFHDSMTIPYEMVLTKQ